MILFNNIRLYCLWDLILIGDFITELSVDVEITSETLQVVEPRIKKNSLFYLWAAEYLFWLDLQSVIVYQ